MCGARIFGIVIGELQQIDAGRHGGADGVHPDILVPSPKNPFFKTEANSAEAKALAYDTLRSLYWKEFTAFAPRASQFLQRLRRVLKSGSKRLAQDVFFEVPDQLGDSVWVGPGFAPIVAGPESVGVVSLIDE